MCSVSVSESAKCRKLASYDGKVAGLLSYCWASVNICHSAGRQAKFFLFTYFYLIIILCSPSIRNVGCPQSVLLYMNSISAPIPAHCLCPVTSKLTHIVELTSINIPYILFISSSPQYHAPFPSGVESAQAGHAQGSPPTTTSCEQRAWLP